MPTHGGVAKSMRETIERLREEVDRLREREVDVARVLDLLGENRADLPRLAHQRIERLRQRVEELEQTQARMIKSGDDLHDALSAAVAEVERLRDSVSRHVCEGHTACADLLAIQIAESARLRTALAALMDGERGEVLEQYHSYLTCQGSDNADRGCPVCIARAALATEVK